MQELCRRFTGALPSICSLLFLAMTGLPACAVVRRVDPSGRKPLLAGMLSVAMKELAFFPRCQEAVLLRLLFRYCAALFQWQIVTPRRSIAIAQGSRSWEEWVRELRAARLLLPVGRLYSTPSAFCRAVRELAPGSVASAGDSPHHALLARIDSGKKLAPYGWVHSLVHTAAPFSRAGYGLRCWLALPHEQCEMRSLPCLAPACSGVAPPTRFLWHAVLLVQMSRMC